MCTCAAAGLWFTLLWQLTQSRLISYNSRRQTLNILLHLLHRLVLASDAHAPPPLLQQPLSMWTWVCWPPPLLSSKQPGRSTKRTASTDPNKGKTPTGLTLFWTTAKHPWVKKQCSLYTSSLTAVALLSHDNVHISTEYVISWSRRLERKTVSLEKHQKQLLWSICVQPHDVTTSHLTSDLLTSGSVHAKFLPWIICLVTLVLIDKKIIKR